MEREKIALLVLAILVLFFNYSYIDSFLENSFESSEYGVVERVIDGDTLVINGTSVRLLGINSPERGEKGYEDAKSFLENRTLNKEVKLIFGKEKFDRYGRKLAYVFLGGENVNLESVREGYSNFYFPSGKDNYYLQFKEAWEDCLIQDTNLCEKSKYECLVLESWDVQGQVVVLKNSCSQELNITGWSVKDEGRKKYVFSSFVLDPGEKIVLTNEDWEENYVWTDSGDSIFIRDGDGKLVYFNSY